VGIPEEVSFQTKPELGWRMIQRAKQRGIPFQAVVMDELYGRKAELRRELDRAHIEYYADVPVDTQVFLLPPQIAGVSSDEVQTVDQHKDLAWETIRLRPSERGYLQADFARVRVWTRVAGNYRREWLLIRKDAGQITYVLSNAPENTTLEQMAWRKSHRYLIERSHQDAKGELGWDEFRARKYRAWEHQLALTILAAWFIAETRLDWMQRFSRDPALLVQYEADVLPQLSVSNVRELLRAAMPLPQLSPQEAAQLVTTHLVNRTRSRKSRLRKKKDIPKS
jgi:SRSO17 transposase